MSARSKAQQAFFAICQHDPKHARGKCPAMAKAKMREFSATPTKGLPQKLSGQARKIG